MQIFLKIIAIILIAFGGFMIFGGIIVLADSQEDIITSIIITLIVGVAPLCGGVLILRKQKRKADIGVATEQKTDKIQSDTIVENSKLPDENVIEQQVEQTTPDLYEVLGTGRIIKVRYDSGNHPGTVREIIPVKLTKEGDKLTAHCVFRKKNVTFFTYYLKIVPDNTKVDYPPVIDAKIDNTMKTVKGCLWFIAIVGGIIAGLLLF